ncbi:hypothetical protein Tco_0827778, partial [Tanacetum coccineum]
QNRRDLPRDIPLDSVVVLRYEKRSKSENKGKVPTEMELVLEQTQQGTSYEVSVSAEGVEELKRKVKIKGEKKEALLTLRQKPDSILQAGNPVKEILLKLNLPDHRILKDGGEGSLEDIPSSNKAKIKYLYTSKSKIQEKIKSQAEKCKLHVTMLQIAPYWIMVLLSCYQFNVQLNLGKTKERKPLELYEKSLNDKFNLNASAANTYLRGLFLPFKNISREPKLFTNCYTKRRSFRMGCRRECSLGCLWTNPMFMDFLQDIENEISSTRKGSNIEL